MGSMSFSKELHFQAPSWSILATTTLDLGPGRTKSARRFQSTIPRDSKRDPKRKYYSKDNPETSSESGLILCVCSVPVGTYIKTLVDRTYYYRKPD